MSVELPEGVHTVELAVPDAYGVLRGKRVPARAWPAVLESGLHMSSIIYSWTPRCEIRDADEWLPPERGWPDMHVFGEKLVTVVCGMARHEHALINAEVSDAERARYLDAF